MSTLIALWLAALFGLSAVSGSAPPATVVESTDAPRVVLEVGHCWVEPFVLDGVEWGVPLRQQVGWGGGLPRGWVGEGEVVVVSGQRATYVDEGGSRLPLRPADRPSVSLAGEVCL